MIDSGQKEDISDAIILDLKYSATITSVKNTK
jgi:hypothetical protein